MFTRPYLLIVLWLGFWLGGCLALLLWALRALL